MSELTKLSKNTKTMSSTMSIHLQLATIVNLVTDGKITF